MANESIDGEQLLALARLRSDEGRAELFAVMGDLFHDRSDVLSAQERALMLDILEKLIGDVARDVKRKLALRLADAPGLPRELAVLLANDEIEVATPILLRSAVLQDVDLIEVIRHRSRQHILTVAMARSFQHGFRCVG